MDADDVRARGTGRWATWGLRAAIVSLVVLAAASPGAMPLWDDEVALLTRAMDANDAGRLAEFGLGGNYGYSYGPLPTQFYQGLLLFTHDLRWIVSLRALIWMTALALALSSLSRTLALPRWFVLVPLGAPWVWFYSRSPWDNTFVIPLGCALLAAYARWLVRPTALSALACAAAATAMPLIHLASASLPLAVAVHAVLARTRAFRAAVGWLALGAMAASATSHGYALHTARQLSDRAALYVAGYDPKPPTRHQSGPTRRIESPGYALRGATLLSAEQRFFWAWKEMPPAGLVGALAGVSRFVHLWPLAGAAMLFVYWRRTSEEDPTEADRVWRLRRAMASIAVGAVVIQAVVFLVMRANWHEHYLGSLFAGIVVLSAMGVERLWAVGRWGRAAVIVPAAASLASTPLLLGLMHYTNGGRTWFAPSISNLVALAEDLAPETAGQAWTDCPQLIGSPQSLHLARRLTGMPPTTLPLSGSTVILRFRKASPSDGWVVVERVTATVPPPGMHLIPLRPSPPDLPR